MRANPRKGATLVLVTAALFVFGGCTARKMCYVESTPAGARIIVNGSYAGTAPCEVELIDQGFGTLTIVATLSGYESATKEYPPVMDWGATLPTYVKFDLQPNDGVAADEQTSSGEARPAEPRVTCDLRVVRVADGAVVAAATGRANQSTLDSLTEQLADKLADDIVLKGNTIALGSLRDRSRSHPGRVLTDEIEDKLAAALVETGWFDVKERVDLRAILSENDLESAGIVNNPEVRAKLSGVKYIVIGGVTVSNRAD